MCFTCLCSHSVGSGVSTMDRDVNTTDSNGSGIATGKRQRSDSMGGIDTPRAKIANAMKTIIEVFL
jgi:hypothetical protein